MKYFSAQNEETALKEIVSRLEMGHVDVSRIRCLRSKGTSARGVIARCHGLSKVQQIALNAEPFYVIELISENFDRLSEEEKIKTLIHELMHIPKNFGGGFRHHDFVTRKNVDILYRELMKK